MKKLVLALLLCVVSTHIAVAEETKPIAEVKPQVSVAEYPKLRVGDVAPSWSLRDIKGNEVDSRRFIGNSAQAWVFNSVKKADSLLPAENQEKKTKFKFYLVHAPTLKDIEKGRERMKENAGKVFLSYRGSMNYLYQEYSFSDSSVAQLLNRLSISERTTEVVIDRAGFIRSVVNYAEPPSGHSFIDPTPILEVGKVAPDFSIPDMNGTVRRVSDLRGRKNLLLTFFPKCFTGGCTNHLTSIQKEYLSYIASDIEVWAVSVDPAEGEKGQIEFAKRWNLQFPLIPDEGRNVSILYGAAQNPNQLASRMSVLIDKEGIVRLIDKQVDIHNHGSDIILQMRRLGMIETSGKPNQTSNKTP